ncbi:MAG: hypothetical protein ABSG53_19925 [Thermoguttaceae bacterium]
MQGVAEPLRAVAISSYRAYVHASGFAIRQLAVKGNPHKFAAIRARHKQERLNVVPACVFVALVIHYRDHAPFVKQVQSNLADCLSIRHVND